MKPICTYLCGPRSSIPDKGKALFTGAAEALRKAGLVVINPIDINIAFLGVEYSPRYENPPLIPTYPGYRADIITLVTACDSIALLPGWEHAIGCRGEVAIAITLKYKFVDWQTGEVIPRPSAVLVHSGYGEELSSATKDLSIAFEQFVRALAEKNGIPIPSPTLDLLDREVSQR